MASRDVPPPSAGLFVTFEGGEGSGKSTQVGRLRARLHALGRDVVVTREPGGSPRAETLRALVLGGAAELYGAFAEALLFAAARADHVDRTVRPALARGAVVLCDRFSDSTFAYQGGAAGLPDDILRALDSAATGSVRPALTFVLDLPVEVGLARARARRERARESQDRFEGEGAAYHQRIREAFLAIAAREPERCVVIAADRPPKQVEAAILSAFKERVRGGRLERVG